MALEKNHDISKYMVTQANTLIEANYSVELTANAHKIARLILSLISPDDKDIRSYTIPIKALKQYLGTSTNAFYQRLKDTAQRLNKQPIEITHKNGKMTVAYFISGYEIDPANGIVRFEISSLLKPFLVDLKNNYTSYLLIHIPKLKSGYSIRIYELLHQYRKIGKRRFELNDLQKKVGSEYKLYGDFKRKVLKQAQKDLKRHTDIAFIFDEIKTGRKVTSIQFMIFANKPVEKENTQLSFLDVIDINEPSETPAFSEEIISLLNKLGIKEQSISKYLAKGFEIVKDEKLRATAITRCKDLNRYYLEKLHLADSSNTTNPIGFLVKALQEDWQSMKSEKKTKNDAVLKKKKEAQKKIAFLEKHITKLNQKYSTTHAEIVKPLLSDNELLEEIFNIVKGTKGMTSLGFVKTDKTAIWNYQQSPIVKSQFDTEFGKRFPNRFSQTRHIVDQIEQSKKEIEKLKKANYIR